MRPRIYLTQPVASSAIERLQKAADLTINNDPLHIVTKDEQLNAAREHDIIFCLLHDKIDADVVVDNILAILAGKRPLNCWNAGICN